MLLLTRILFQCLGVLVVALLCGCGQGDKVTSADMKAFDSGPPDLKQNWTKAQTAAASKDYVTAILTLRTLMPKDLSKEQRIAVQNAMSTYDGRLVSAADHGDAAAQKALETLRLPVSQSGR